MFLFIFTKDHFNFDSKPLAHLTPLHILIKRILKTEIKSCYVFWLWCVMPRLLVGSYLAIYLKGIWRNFFPKSPNLLLFLLLSQVAQGSSKRGQSVANTLPLAKLIYVHNSLNQRSLTFFTFGTPRLMTR